jgi:hypothetical protein
MSGSRLLGWILGQVAQYKEAIAECFDRFQDRSDLVIGARAVRRDIRRLERRCPGSRALECP